MAFVGLVSIASAAHGQSANEGPAPAMSQGLEEIIVTARRRTESLQDVPQTVNAVTSDVIERLNLLEFEDIQNVVPGLNLEGGLNSGASIRGVTFETFTQTSPTVEFYLNDSSIEPGILFQTIYDVGQIEVLRGPQGTLRGRAAPSGAITFTTRRPDLSEAGGYVSTTATHTDDTNVQGAFGMPLIQDVLAVRVAGVYDNNDLSGVRSATSSAKSEDETIGGRVSFLFEPSDAFSAVLMYQFNDRTTDSFMYPVFGPGAPAHPTHPANFNGPALSIDDYRAVQEFPSRQEQEFKNATLQVDWRFAGHSLSYVGGWIDTDIVIGANGRTDGDTANVLQGVNGIGQMPDTVTEQFVNELRLSSEERIAGLFDYTIGVFTYRVRGTGLQVSPARFMPGAFGSPLGLSDPNAFDPRYVLWSEVPRVRNEDERSAFANINLHLTDKTELSLGGRKIISESDSKAYIGVRQGMMAMPLAALGGFCPTGMSTYPGTCDLPIAASSTLFGAPREDQPFIYSASLSHRFTEDLMAYVNTGTSWRRGPGPVLGLPSCSDVAYCEQFLFLENEESESYEIGMKSSLFDRRVTFNLAVYQQTYDGLIAQHSATPYLGAGDVVQSSGSFNANGDAKVRGVDLESSFAVTPRWTIGLAAAYAKGEFDNAMLPCRDSNFDGVPDSNPLPLNGAAWIAAGGPDGPALCASSDSSQNAPEWQATLQSEYSFPLYAGADAFVRGLFNYYPENDNPSSAKDFTVDSHGLLNLYLGLRSPSGAWEVSAFAKNALDDDTLTYIADQQVSSFGIIGSSGSTFGESGYRSFGRVPEREIGLTLRYSFGAR